MHDNPKELKNELRKQYKQIRAELSAEERAERDAKICNAILSLASYRFADTLLTYAPTTGEIDVSAVAIHALNSGKKVAFPLCNVETHTMTFKIVTSIDQLVTGSYSIPEPSADAEAVIDFSGSLCLVPGLVFDNEGYRVGYGKGYYDRFLGTYKQTKLGIVYSDFVLSAVPRGRFDRCVDILVTERGIKLATNK